jgi:hypothetical protein
VITGVVLLGALNVASFRQGLQTIRYWHYTDVPDSRAAGAHFRVGKSGQAAKRRRAGSRSPVRDFAQIVDYFTDEADRRLVILGAPGAGKAVLAVTLTVGLLEQRENAPAEQRRNLPVPCLLYLPSWNPEGAGLEDWLEAQLASRFRVGRKAAERLVRDGRVLPVLDGLDEMDSQETSSARSQGAVTRIPGRKPLRHAPSTQVGSAGC